MRGIMTARTKPLKVIEPVGEGARTEVAEYALPPKKQGVKLIPAESAGDLIKLLRNEAKVI
jgi:electron transfer flavoprotein beta subunit